MNYSLFPQSPPVWKGCLLLLNPPFGGANLKLKNFKLIKNYESIRILSQPNNF